MVLYIQSALLWRPPNNYCNYWLHKSGAAVGLSCKMWFISPLCVKWYPTLSSPAKPMEMKKSIFLPRYGFGSNGERGVENLQKCRQVWVLYSENKLMNTSNLFKLGVTLFQCNELLLFANLGHPVDGNSCAGIDQGRYYQLLAKTVQLAKWTDCFMKLALSQIVPFPIQRNKCIESVRLRKETPINSAKMQEFVQPLAMTRTDLIWPAAKWNNYFDRLKKSEKWMKAVWIAPLVVSDVNVKEYLLSWLRELI